MTFNESEIMAIIPVLDYRRAKHFYEGVLGFTVTDLPGVPGNGMFEAGHGTRALLYERGPSHAEHTIAGFLVEDLDSTMRTLRDHGVAFEDYDLPYLTTVSGVATAGDIKTAWFKDTEGNILSITEAKAEVLRKVA